MTDGLHKSAINRFLGMNFAQRQYVQPVDEPTIRTEHGLLNAYRFRHTLSGKEVVLNSIGEPFKDNGQVWQRVNPQTAYNAFVCDPIPLSAVGAMRILFGDDLPAVIFRGERNVLGVYAGRQRANRVYILEHVRTGARLHLDLCGQAWAPFSDGTWYAQDAEETLEDFLLEENE